MNDDEQLRIGDIVSFGPHAMPAELVGKYFRIEAHEGVPNGVQAWALSKPYIDPDCTQRYYSEAAPKVKRRG